MHLSCTRLLLPSTQSTFHLSPCNALPNARPSQPSLRGVHASATDGLPRCPLNPSPPTAQHVRPYLDARHPGQGALQQAGMCLIETANQHRHSTVTSAVQTTVPGLDQPISFPHLGSGLLFARTTGLKIWPGARVLAAWMLSHAEYVASAHLVVELGAGLGLCSVVATRIGAQVVATDGDADLVRLLRKNLAHNIPDAHHKPHAEALIWDVEGAAAFCGRHGKADLVLLTDVVYGSDPGVWEALLDTLEVLVAQGACVMQAETKRLEGVLYHMYLEGAVKRGWAVEEVDVEPYLPEDINPGLVRMWRMQRGLKG